MDSKNDTTFAGREIITLCESFMEYHRALKTNVMIFNDFDFEKDNGNVFQGKIKKKWFLSVIDSMIVAQLERLDRIATLYKEEKDIIATEPPSSLMNVID